MKDNLRNNCVLCLHNITNPVCTECYMKHVDFWMDNFGMNGLERNVVLNRIRKHLYLDTLNPEKCIICGIDPVSLCSYCFFFIVEKVLRELNFNDSCIDDFRALFSYQ